MAAGSGLSEEEIKRYVKRKLGDGIVKVELTNDHMDDIIRDTRRWLVNRAGIETFIDIQVNRGSTRYKLPDHVVDVYDVYLPSDALANIAGDDDFSRQYAYFFGLWYTQSYGATGSGGSGYGSFGAARGQDQAPYSNLLQRLQMLETIGRIWGADSDWEYEPRTCMLNIMPAPGRAGVAMIRVNTLMFDTRKLLPEEEDLFLRWAIAEAKETLGRIRSKYDTVPTVGGDRSLDGDTLLLEAQSEKEVLERQVLDRNTDVARFILTG